MPSDDQTDFSIHKGTILLLLDLHSKQLDKIMEKLEGIVSARAKEVDLLNARITAIEEKINNIDSGLFLAKKGIGALVAEGLKIATAIFTAYLLIKFGMKA